MQIITFMYGGCPSERKESNCENAFTIWKYNLKNIIENTYNCNQKYPDEFEKAFE